MPSPQLLVPLGLLVLLLVVQVLFVGIGSDFGTAATALCTVYTVLLYYFVAYGFTRRGGWSAAIAIGLVSLGWVARNTLDLGYAGLLVPMGPGMLIAQPADSLHGKLLAWRAGDPCRQSPEALERRHHARSFVLSAATLPGGASLLVVYQTLPGTEVEWHKLVHLLPSGEVDASFSPALACLPDGVTLSVIDDVGADGSFVLGPSRSGSRNNREDFFQGTAQGVLTSLAESLPPEDSRYRDRLARVRRHPLTGRLTVLIDSGRIDSDHDLVDPEAKLELWQAGEPAIDLKPLLRGLAGKPRPKPDYLFLPDGRLVLPVNGAGGDAGSCGVATLDLRRGTARWTRSQGFGLAPVGLFADGALLLADDDLDRQHLSTTPVLEILSLAGASQTISAGQLQVALPGFTPQRAAALAGGEILLAGTIDNRMAVRIVDRLGRSLTPAP
jgi:hypothetical protein